MYCKYCGAEISDNSKFCSKCGATLESGTKNFILSKKGVIIIAVICAAVFVAGAIGGALIIRHKSDDADRNSNQLIETSRGELNNSDSDEKNPTGSNASSSGESHSEKTAKQSQLSESELKKKAENEIGNVVQFEYHDYDDNGTKEAFFVSATEDKEWGGSETPWEVYFVNSDGKIELVYNESEWSYYFNDSMKYYEASDSQGFFYYDKGAYGSGWLTDIFTVKNNKPKKLNTDGFQGFHKRSDGTFYTTQNEFGQEGGHSYPEYKLIYDSSSCEFTIGSKLD